MEYGVHYFIWFEAQKNCPEVVGLQAAGGYGDAEGPFCFPGIMSYEWLPLLGTLYIVLAWGPRGREVYL